MLKKTCVTDIKGGRVSRNDGHIVIAMCHYPRGLAKNLIDEYIHALAPDKGLLDDFHAERDKLHGNHNAAFVSMHYQSRFKVTDDAIEQLKRLSELSGKQDVYLACQCALDQRCHREMLLILAKRWFGAVTELRKFSYSEFEQRIPEQPQAF